MTPQPKMSAATAGVGMKQLPGGRLPASGSSSASLAEEQPEPRPRGGELRRRSHGEVELQCVRGRQERAVDGRPRFEVGELYSLELLGERARPVRREPFVTGTPSAIAKVRSRSEKSIAGSDC